MKADQSLSSIFRQLRPTLRQPASRFLQAGQTPPISAFHQPAISYWPTARTLTYPSRISCVQDRYNSTSASISPSSVPTSTTDSPSAPEAELEPKYQITFTCKPCQHRSTHQISQHGYKNGTILIQCPSCKNRHLIADHLKIFADKSTTVEDLMREKGQLVKRGSIAGDMEFWDDGTETERAKA